MVYLGGTRRIHFVGIGGIGMSGIAEVLLNLGFEVSGSDLKRTDLTVRLEGLGARISYAHKRQNVLGADVVVYSSAVGQDNPELEEAEKKAIPKIPRTEMLAELMRLKFAVTVAGSHGKTSTTSLIASVLASGGLDPTVVVGGKLGALSSNARLGSGRYLVAEADESDGEFVKLPSTVAVITTIDLEHLDYYPDLDAIMNSFIEYANRVPFYGSVILCSDEENVKKIAPEIKRRKVTYSLLEGADVVGKVTKRDETGCCIEVSHREKAMGVIHVGIPGDHYARNALAAVAVGFELEIPFDLVKGGIEGFEGVGRRFEIKGVPGGVMVIDDYGHHPTEIAATIRAAIDNFGRRLVVLFQPHRFSRTKALADGFGGCFEGAYKVFVTDIYPAGEEPIAGVSAETIVSSVKRSSEVPVAYAPSFEAMVAEAVRILREGDMVLTMGAGDIYKASDLLIEKLEGSSH